MGQGRGLSGLSMGAYPSVPLPSFRVGDFSLKLSNPQSGKQLEGTSGTNNLLRSGAQLSSFNICGYFLRQLSSCLLGICLAEIVNCPFV